MYKLVSLPISVNAGVLQMQLKQIAIFAEQVYLIYISNCSGTSQAQALYTVNGLKCQQCEV